VSDAASAVPAYRPQSYSSLERLAAHVRARLLPGHSDMEAVPGLELFERLDEYTLNVRGVSVQLDYAVEDLAPGLEAQAYYAVEEESIVVALTEATYDDLRLGIGRALFTVGHEIGHAVLHPAELVDRCVTTVDSRALHRGGVVTHKPFVDTEWQANGFAAALLMPASGLARMESIGRLDMRTVANNYLVSLQAAELRLKVFAERRRDLL
jgi:GNAT superfamily N-acetyltransferase